MRAFINISIILLCLATLIGCAFMEGLVGYGGDIVSDPDVQRAAGGIVQNLGRGNYMGAVYSFGELLVGVVTAVKTTNVVRDRRRKKRNEPVGITVPVEPPV